MYQTAWQGQWFYLIVQCSIVQLNKAFDQPSAILESMHIIPALGTPCYNNLQHSDTCTTYIHTWTDGCIPIHQDHFRNHPFRQFGNPTHTHSFRPVCVWLAAVILKAFPRLGQPNTGNIAIN